MRKYLRGLLLAGLVGSSGCLGSGDKKPNTVRPARPDEPRKAEVPPAITKLMPEDITEDNFAQQVNGGQEPTSTAAQSATTAKLNQARCRAAKALNVQVNPQFGRLDYSKVAVVPALAIVSRPAGPAKAASKSGLTPAC